MAICRKRRDALISCLVVVALVFVGCRGAAAQTPGPPHQQLTIGIAQRLPSLHPLVSPVSMASFLWGFVNRSVAGFDDSWSAVCFLCTEIPTRENGRIKLVSLPDNRQGMDITYTLRPGLNWADGVAVSSWDVVFAVEVAQAIGVGSYATPYYAHILSVTAADAKTVTLHFDEVNYSFAVPVDLELLPAHLEEPLFRAAASPADYLAHSAYITRPTEPGLWNGPYRLVHYDRDSIVLERNAFWNGPPPQFRRITLRPIPDGAVPAVWLLDSGIDYITGEVVGLPIQQAITLAGQYPDRFDLISRPTLSYEHVALNNANPLLADFRVRQALLLAIDRTAMAQQLFQDTAAIADTPISPHDPDYDPSVHHYPYDPARARGLLAEAGFRPKADGILEDAGGHRLAILLMVPSGNPERQQMSESILKAWQAIGVAATMSVVPADRYFGQVLPQGKFDAAIFAWFFTPAIPQTTFLSTEAIPTPQNKYSGLNYDRFSDRALDDLAKPLVNELDPSRRLIQTRKFQKIFGEKLPDLPLFWHDGTFLIPKWLGGVVPTGHRTATSYWVERWHAE